MVKSRDPSALSKLKSKEELRNYTSIEHHPNSLPQLTPKKTFLLISNILKKLRYQAWLDIVTVSNSEIHLNKGHRK